MATLVRRNFDELERGECSPRTDNVQIIETFLSSGYDCAEVVDYDQMSCHACAASLGNTIRRCNFKNVNVMIRSGNVYLVRNRP